MTHCQYVTGHHWVAVWANLDAQNRGEPPVAVTCDGCGQVRVVTPKEQQ